MLLGRYRAAVLPSVSFAVSREPRQRLFCFRNPSFKVYYWCSAFRQVVHGVLSHISLFLPYFMLVSIFIPNLEYFLLFLFFSLFSFLLLSPYSDHLDLDTVSDLERDLSELEGAWGTVVPPPRTCLSGNWGQSTEDSRTVCGWAHQLSVLMGLGYMLTITGRFCLFILIMLCLIFKNIHERQVSSSIKICQDSIVFSNNQSLASCTVNFSPHYYLFSSNIW